MFYHAIWDPWLIVAQMLLMQCAFYLLSGAWLLLFALAFGTPLRLDALLAPAHMQMTAGARWPALGAVLLQAPALGYLLLPVVGRAKQCLDFTATVYVFHFLLSSVYQRAFPSNWEWWGANAVACVVSVVLGEYLCLQRELEAIPLTAEEREMRERRAATQNAINAAGVGAAGSGGHGHDHNSREDHDAHLEERDGLLSCPQTPEVTTTTIRLAPHNAFNV